MQVKLQQRELGDFDQNNGEIVGIQDSRVLYRQPSRSRAEPGQRGGYGSTEERDQGVGEG
jgi:hypothetical protein